MASNGREGSPVILDSATFSHVNNCITSFGNTCPIKSN
jgi:hypothetical protein